MIFVTEKKDETFSFAVALDLINFFSKSLVLQHQRERGFVSLIITRQSRQAKLVVQQ